MLLQCLLQGPECTLSVYLSLQRRGPVPCTAKCNSSACENFSPAHSHLSPPAILPLVSYTFLNPSKTPQNSLTVFVKVFRWSALHCVDRISVDTSSSCLNNFFYSLWKWRSNSFSFCMWKDFLCSEHWLGSFPNYQALKGWGGKVLGTWKGKYRGRLTFPFGFERFLWV